MKETERRPSVPAPLETDLPYDHQPSMARPKEEQVFPLPSKDAEQVSDSDAPTSPSPEKRNQTNRERMQMLAIPADPLDRQCLPGRFANAIQQLVRYDSYFEQVFMDLAHCGQLADAQRISGVHVHERWARENPDEAEQILEHVVLYLDDLCRALRTREAGTNRKRPSRRRIQKKLFPSRPRLRRTTDLTEQD